MAPASRQAHAEFIPSEQRIFRFLSRELDEQGRVTLRYALGEEHEFDEQVELPVERPLQAQEVERVQGLLSLLHWVAGVSYFKAAAPPLLDCGTGEPGPAAAALLEALYSEGLGEFAFVNRLPALPRPVFPRHGSRQAPAATASPAPRRVLVPVGGGKDSAVALEIVRRSGTPLALFSVGNAPPIARTVQAAGLPRLLARRRIDPELLALNARGALNGHVPVTAIVACIALLTAALNGFDAVALANERSASSGNVTWDGIEVNHQFSKSLRAERLLAAAAQEALPGIGLFSVLRPASELAIARAFARIGTYDSAFTSCNAIFRLDPELRSASWCCDCPKCRFVFLALAPFMEPGRLAGIFGADLLDDEDQFEGFALLTATGGHKPFECVGEEQESIAALRLLAADSRWSGHRVVARMAAEVLPLHPLPEGDPDRVLALSEEHLVPASLLGEVRAVLGA